MPHRDAHLDGDIVVLLDEAVLILGPKDNEIVHFDDAGAARLKDGLQAIDGSGTAGFAQETSIHFHVLAHHAPEELIPPVACISQTLREHHGRHLDLLSNWQREKLVRGDNAGTSCPRHRAACPPCSKGQQLQLISMWPLPSISSRKINPDSTRGDRKQRGVKVLPGSHPAPCTSTPRDSKEDGVNGS